MTRKGDTTSRYEGAFQKSPENQESRNAVNRAFKTCPASVTKTNDCGEDVPLYQNRFGFNLLQVYAPSQSGYLSAGAARNRSPSVRLSSREDARTRPPPRGRVASVICLLESAPRAGLREFVLGIHRNGDTANPVQSMGYRCPQLECSLSHPTGCESLVPTWSW